MGNLFFNKAESKNMDVTNSSSISRSLIQPVVDSCTCQKLDFGGRVPGERMGIFIELSTHLTCI